MISFTYETDEGEEIETELPSKFEVCDRCRGHGTHLNPSIGEHAYTPEEFEEAFFEEEDRAEYFKRGGRYDVSCEECHGRRVVEAVDVAACALDPELTEALKRYDAKLEDDYAYERECAAERRMGC
jgi:hypothetical protein